MSKHVLCLHTPMTPRPANHVRVGPRQWAGPTPVGRGFTAAKPFEVRIPITTLLKVYATLPIMLMLLSILGRN